MVRRRGLAGEVQFPRKVRFPGTGSATVGRGVARSDSLLVAFRTATEAIWGSRPVQTRRSRRWSNVGDTRRGDSMRGRRWTMAMEGGGGQRLFKGDVELGVPILENLQIVPCLIWRHATLGVIEIHDLFGVDKLAVDVVNLSPQVMLQRRRGMATSSGPVPLA